jgi:hypothetical protein
MKIKSQKEECFVEIPSGLMENIEKLIDAQEKVRSLKNCSIKKLTALIVSCNRCWSYE